MATESPGPIPSPNPAMPCVICRAPVYDHDDEEHEVGEDGKWIGYHFAEHCAEAQARIAVDVTRWDD